MDNRKKTSRSGYVSPYLRAPLRSLDEVLSRRAEPEARRRTGGFRTGSADASRRDDETSGAAEPVA